MAKKETQVSNAAESAAPALNFVKDFEAAGFPDYVEVDGLTRRNGWSVAIHIAHANQRIDPDRQVIQNAGYRAKVDPDTGVAGIVPISQWVPLEKAAQMEAARNAAVWTAQWVTEHLEHIKGLENPGKLFQSPRYTFVVFLPLSNNGEKRQGSGSGRTLDQAMAKINALGRADGDEAIRVLLNAGVTLNYRVEFEDAEVANGTLESAS